MDTPELTTEATEPTPLVDLRVAEASVKAALQARDQARFAAREHLDALRTSEPLSVDGERAAVAWVTSLPAGYTTPAQRLVLLTLALGSYDGVTAAPGLDLLALWTGMRRDTVNDALKALEQPTPRRPALIARVPSGRRPGRHRVLWSLNSPAVPDGSTELNSPAVPEPDRPDVDVHLPDHDVPADYAGRHDSPRHEIGTVPTGGAS